jgi:hypothetical protein
MDVELCEIPTPIIAHPHRIAMLVRSHATRPLRPEPGEVCEFHVSEGAELAIFFGDCTIRPSR